jgi:hypothetical protein
MPRSIKASARYHSFKGRCKSSANVNENRTSQGKNAGNIPIENRGKQAAPDRTRNAEPFANIGKNTSVSVKA